MKRGVATKIPKTSKKQVRQASTSAADAVRRRALVARAPLGLSRAVYRGAGAAVSALSFVRSAKARLFTTVRVAFRTIWVAFHLVR